MREQRSLGYYALVIRPHFLSIWAIRAVVIRVTDIHFLEKTTLYHWNECKVAFF